MKAKIIYSVAIVLCLSIVLFIFSCTSGKSTHEIKTTEKNPWTHLKFKNDPNNFQFVIVGDRAGGTRHGVFNSAITKINSLQPEFVISVGDLTSGSKYPDSLGFNDQDRLNLRWEEFNEMVNRLEMPFFYVPGNADVVFYGNKEAHDELFATRGWKDRFDKTYYHFVYKNVLFLILNSDDPPIHDDGMISNQQLQWMKETMNSKKNVRWIMMFLHRPLWLSQPEIWKQVDEAIGDRPATIFCGHHHRYNKSIINKRTHIMLATTGGASKLEGTKEGRFDHIAWITMTQGGPLITNLLLDGILGDNPVRD